jgi:hypothetical protein
LIVDSALASCKHLKNEYVVALNLSDAGISAASLDKLSDTWISEIRTVYIKHVDELLTSSKIADVRLKVISMTWTKCVVQKAKDWSLLRDDAASIAIAASTSCASYKMLLRAASIYQLRSQHLPIPTAESTAEKVIEKFAIEMKDIAIETVISERAKRLPKK